MDIQTQIKNAKISLENQGRNAEEIEYFEAFAELLLIKSLGLFSDNFSELLSLAQERGDPDSDTRAAYTFNLQCKLDCSDLNIADLILQIGYSKAFKQKSAGKIEIHPSAPNPQTTIPGVDDSNPPEDPELPPEEEPAGQMGEKIEV